MGNEGLVWKIRRNLILPIMALALTVIESGLYIISNLVFDRAVEEGSTFPMVVVLILNIMILLLSIASLVLLLIWVIRSYIMTSGREPGIQRDSIYGIIFFSMYAVFFVAYPMLFAPVVMLLTGTDLALYHYINSFFYLTFLFIYLIALTFPVRRMITNGQRFALMFSVILIMAISIQSSRVNQEATGFLFYLDSFITLAGWSGILVVYYLLFRTLEDRKDPGGPYETELRKGLAKEGWRRRLTLISDRKPFHILLAVAVILGAQSTFGYFLDREEYNRDAWFPIGYLEWGDEDQPTGTYTFNAMDIANEGEEIRFPLMIESDPDRLEVTLRWEDEPDTLLWENQPETFNLQIGDLKEATVSNTQGEEGKIILSANPGYVEDIDIIVTLVDSGYYRRPVGPSLMQKTDGSNEFEIIIVIEYPDPENE